MYHTPHIIPLMDYYGYFVCITRMINYINGVCRIIFFLIISEFNLCGACNIYSPVTDFQTAVCLVQIIFIRSQTDIHRNILRCSVMGVAFFRYKSVFTLNKFTVKMYALVFGYKYYQSCNTESDNYSRTNDYNDSFFI